MNDLDVMEIREKSGLSLPKRGSKTLL